MIPGTTTKLTEGRVTQSGNEIHARTDIVYIEGNGEILKWIWPHFSGSPGLLILVAITQPVTLQSGAGDGNIYGYSTILLHRYTTLIWSKMFQGWFIGSGGTIE